MCGLAGIISNKPTSFNITQFEMLGMLNDERGGDSCGIFIDGSVKYGLNEDSYFRDYTNKLEYPESFQIAMLHCRATSSMNNTSLYQAQPVCIYNQQGKLEYMLMHNGTIYNSHILAKTYIPKIDVNNMSDSQIMAHIFYHKGYDCLNEYLGTATFVIIDYRSSNPEILFFKGDSEFNPINKKEERPLYCIFYEDKFYFSSMTYPLKLISRDSSIYIIPVGKLCKLTNDYKFQVKLITNRYQFDSKKVQKLKKKFNVL